MQEDELIYYRMELLLVCSILEPSVSNADYVLCAHFCLHSAWH